MSKQNYRFILSLTLKTPFLSHKAGAQQFGLDMSMLKDEQNNPVFLGSLVRGNLRHTLTNFKELLENAKEQDTEKSIEGIKQVLGLFGKESLERSYAPQRAILNFDYYWKQGEEQPVTTTLPRYRIGINEKTGTVQKGNFQVIESVYKQGQNIEFKGVIQGKLTDDEARNCEKWLLKAAQYLPAIGALKGTGFGKIEEAKIKQNIIEKQTVERVEITQDRIGICISPDRPLCIAKPHAANHNRFTSEEHIPGNVLIGAIAQQLPEDEEKPAWLNNLIITHALPSAKNKAERQRVLPLSLIKGKDNVDIYDLALSNPEKGKVLLLIKDNKFMAPTYQPDWKGEVYGAAEEKSGLNKHHPQRQLIVCTAIEKNSNTAEEGKLFSLDCVSPHKTIWCADIDFSLIVDATQKKQAQKTIAEIIQNGLQGIGKTKANITLALQDESFTNILKKISDEENSYIITLQTPARLFAAPDHIKATDGAEAVLKAYQEYWFYVSGGKLSLTYYFAQQTKTGGEFFRHYYKQKKYQPQWLTQSGSVFVLTATNKQTDMEEIQNRLKDWQQHGLPQAKDKGPEDKKDSGWKTNPYIRQNGFGEICVNEEIHKKLKLAKQQGEWK